MTEKKPWVCWKCGQALPPFDFGKVSFRAVCDACGADLHVCKNCCFFCPGKPNDCNIPGTEWISDRERANFCEDFKIKGDKFSSSGPSVDDISKKLFND